MSFEKHRDKPSDVSELRFVSFRETDATGCGRGCGRDMSGMINEVRQGKEREGRGAPTRKKKKKKG